MRFGLPSSHRLLRPAQFRRILRHACRSKGDAFLVCAQSNGRKNHRLGITVSRKVDKRAVVRNRIKRHVREFFRQHPPGAAPGAVPSAMPGATPGAKVAPPNDSNAQAVDIVVIAHKAAASLSPPALRTELARHWRHVQSRVHR